jgi:hypothetical protein
LVQGGQLYEIWSFATGSSAFPNEDVSGWGS